MPVESARLRPRRGRSAPPPLAPTWHTAVLAGLIVTVAAAGTMLEGRSDHAAIRRPSWLVALAQLALVQAGLLVYVTRVGRGGWVLAEAGTRWWRGPRAAAIDACLAALAVVAIVGAETSWHLLVARPSAAGSALSPHTTAEVATWIAAAVVVGVVEEVVYRGYLQRHLGALLRSPQAGLGVAAFLFGVAHLEQGAPFAARAALYGLILGALAMARGSLLPAVLAHVVIDVLAGVGAIR